MKNKSSKCKQCGRRCSYGARFCAECRRGHHKGSMNANWGNFRSNSILAGRSRAQHRKVLNKCELCGRQAYDRHHINGNTLNNNPSNLLAVCRSCHMILDGRIIRRNVKGQFTKRRRRA